MDFNHFRVKLFCIIKLDIRNISNSHTTASANTTIHIVKSSQIREDFSFLGPRHTSKSTLLRFAAKRMMVSGVCRPAASSFSQEETIMDFFNSAIEVLQTLVVALGAGLGVWGVINLLEGYGNDNPGANAHVR